MTAEREMRLSEKKPNFTLIKPKLDSFHIGEFAIPSDIC